MKQKLLASALFLGSLIPACFVQFGFLKGVCEAPPFMVLRMPLGGISISLFFIGVWCGVKVLPYLGMVGMVVTELVALFSWHWPAESIAQHFRHGLGAAYPAFYIGLFCSIMVIVVYDRIFRRNKG